MKFVFQNVKYDALFLLRRAGYGFERKDHQTGELSFGKRLSVNQYPKFHVYARKENGNLVVNLHLDQKRPSYEGYTAHGGEYDGEVLEEEARRIKILIEKAVKETGENEVLMAKLEVKRPFFQKIFKALSGDKK